MTAVETSAPGNDPLDTAAREELRDLFTVESLQRHGPAFMVYVARDVRDDQQIALRVMPRSASAATAAEDAFQQSAAAVGGLRHVHIVRLRRAGVTRRFFWYATEYVDGPSLAEVLQENGPMDLLPCLRVVEQVASALDYAHRRGVVHGNLNPASVLLDSAGWVRVADFSMPRLLERLGALSVPGAGGMRQPPYIAPEESSSRSPDAHVDQYALATLIYESLSGTFAAGPNGGPPSQALPLLCDTNPRVPRHAAVAVHRALSVAPGARFASVVEFVSALETPATPPPPAVRGARAAPRPVPSPVPRPPVLLFPMPDDETGPSKWRWVSLGAVVLAVAGAAIALALTGSDRDARGTIAVPVPVATAPPDSAAMAPPSVEPVDLDRGRVIARGPSSANVRVAPPPPPPRPPAPPPPQARPLPARPGRLFVNATPWGRIYVDGVLVGNTPKVAIPVTPGTHSVRIMRDGYAPFERTVSVASGQDLRLTDVVLAELQP